MVLMDNFVGFETTGLEERGGSMNFVFTGRCTYRGDAWDRAAMQRLVTQAGHRTHNTISRHTHYLVASRTDTRKAAAAERFGVTVITYDIFMTMMENSLRELSSVHSPVDFEIPSRSVVGLPLTLDDLVASRGIINRPNLSTPQDINPCSEVHLPTDHRVTSKNRPVRTVAHGGRIRRNLDL